MPQTQHIQRHFRYHDCAEGGRMKKSSSITALFLDIGGVLLTDGWHPIKNSSNAKVLVNITL